MFSQNIIPVKYLVVQI